MSKFEALVRVKTLWNNPALSLYEKATEISDEFYGNGLDLSGTSAYIGATPTELDSLLIISEIDEELLKRISDAKPPRTSWMMIANASDKEIDAAIDELSNAAHDESSNSKSSMEERVYSAMIHVAGIPPEQAIASAPSKTLYAIASRAKEYKAVPEKEIKFLNSVAARRKVGKTLTEKQARWLVDILNRMADAEIIKRNGIDADQEHCDYVLDVLGR
ncbi:MAG: hypothetical protein ACOX69_09275 [Coriobacteriales bacterium]|jgi:hypothetical protein